MGIQCTPHFRVKAQLGLYPGLRPPQPGPPPTIGLGMIAVYPPGNPHVGIIPLLGISLLIIMVHLPGNPPVGIIIIPRLENPLLVIVVRFPGNPHVGIMYIPLLGNPDLTFSILPGNPHQGVRESTGRRGAGIGPPVCRGHLITMGEQVGIPFSGSSPVMLYRVSGVQASVWMR